MFQSCFPSSWIEMGLQVAILVHLHTKESSLSMNYFLTWLCHQLIGRHSHPREQMGIHVNSKTIKSPGFHLKTDSNSLEICLNLKRYEFSRFQPAERRVWKFAKHQNISKVESQLAVCQPPAADSFRDFDTLQSSHQFIMVNSKTGILCVWTHLSVRMSCTICVSSEHRMDNQGEEIVAIAYSHVLGKFLP